MSYVALYRKWRPHVFEDVVGQKHIVRTLKNSIITGRIAHAYLFCGSHGTGKTTTAKLLARAVNCLNPCDGNPCNQCEICRGILDESMLDVIEIDAASNNSVDNVREIRDEVVYSPSHARYKVYIIDEVHMLSAGAFNALLKTLEEPPAHVIFILATTESHKLPSTIVSRCQKYEFRRIAADDIVQRLREISSDSGTGFEDKALKLIAKVSGGALRDAISILDQCISTGGKNITYHDVLSVIGAANDDILHDILKSLIDRDIAKVLLIVDDIVMSGKDVGRFCSDLVLYLRNILMVKVAGQMNGIIDDVDGKLAALAGELEEHVMVSMIKELSATEASLKWASQPRIMLEMCMVKLCRPESFLNEEQPVSRAAAAQNKQDSGAAQNKQDSAAVQNSQDDGAQHQQGVLPGQAPARDTLPGVPDEKSNRAAFTEFTKWKDVQESLKKSGRMSIFANLIGTRAVHLNEKVVTVIFSQGDSLKKTIISKFENLKLIEDTVSSIMGREIKLKCVDAEELQSVPHPAAVHDEENDAIKKVMELSEKFNIPVNVIDE